MPTTLSDPVRIKRRNSGLAGPPATLLNAELAYNEVGNILYYGSGIAGDGASAETIIEIGGPGAFISVSSSPTLAGDFTFTGTVTVPDPINPTDVANRGYVDSVAQGLTYKSSVLVMSSINLVPSGLFLLDGVLLQGGMRVLLTGQTDASQNGIYLANGSEWSRSPDANTSLELLPGTYVYVEAGETYAQTGWVLTTIGTIELGTTDLTFVQFTGAGSLSVGTGLAQVANQIKIDPAYAGQTSITTLGTVSTGIWHGTPVALQYGGTGANLSSLATDSLLKVSGSSIVAAVPGTDYIATITEIALAHGGTGTNLTLLSDNTILKKVGSELVPAVQDVDYKGLESMNYLAQGGAGIDLTTFTTGSLLKLGTSSVLPAVPNTDYLVPNIFSVTPTNSKGVMRSATDATIQLALKTPSSSSDIGVQGTVCWDANYFYVCTSSNTWKRVALATW